MTPTLQHRLLSLQTRVNIMCDANDDYSVIDLDEEAKSIFSRYETIRLELISMDGTIFGELVPRIPLMGSRENTFQRKSLSLIQADLLEIERGLSLIDENYSENDHQKETVFWSRRTNSVAASDWFKDASSALLARIDRLGNDGCFVQDFSYTCCTYCEAPYGFSADKVNLALKEYIPGLKYPFGWHFTEDQVYDLIEFFYQHAVSISAWKDCAEDRCATRYSKLVGRKHYSTEINKIFCRFGAPYRLIQGEVSRVNSQIVETILEEPIITTDLELNKLLARAVKAFRDRSDKRVEAAEICCKAFEHFKHRFGANTKTSTQAIIAGLVDSDDQAEKLNLYWKALTDLGHAANRHSKPSSPSTSDSEFAEYLFLQYYTAIYFGCRKLERKEEDKDNSLEQELSAFTADEIPF